MSKIKQDNSHLINECKRIEEDCTYNAETHHSIASCNDRISFWIKFIPAAVAAGSGIAVLKGSPIWVAWLSILSGVVFALATILNPDRNANDHTKAAKDFTVLKHDSRALYQTFSHEMSQSEYYISVRLLRDRYNNLIRHTPKTSDKAFRKASKKIKAGSHRPDFEKKMRTYELLGFKKKK
jgi:hypothetical protein